MAQALHKDSKDWFNTHDLIPRLWDLQNSEAMGQKADVRSVRRVSHCTSTVDICGGFILETPHWMNSQASSAPLQRINPNLTFISVLSSAFVLFSLVVHLCLLSCVQLTNAKLGLINTAKRMTNSILIENKQAFGGNVLIVVHFLRSGLISAWSELVNLREDEEQGFGGYLISSNKPYTTA